jgi:hypothetical protein
MAIFDVAGQVFGVDDTTLSTIRLFIKIIVSYFNERS